MSVSILRPRHSLRPNQGPIRHPSNRLHRPLEWRQGHPGRFPTLQDFTEKLVCLGAGPFVKMQPSTNWFLLSNILTRLA